MSIILWKDNQNDVGLKGILKASSGLSETDDFTGTATLLDSNDSPVVGFTDLPLVYDSVADEARVVIEGADLPAAGDGYTLVIVGTGAWEDVIKRTKPVVIMEP
ncbi:MAG: hypothetical protein RIS39_1172 [Actinomycetota bacterium]|jgi:hypothetical protein